MINTGVLIIKKKEVTDEIEIIRNELQAINECLSYPNSDFELRYVQEEIFKKYSQKSNELVIINDQIRKMTKEKSTVRQESTLKKTTNH